MVDLGLCGLVLSVFLFITPSAIYLTYGFKCFGGNERSQFCWNVSEETAVVLAAFGFIFLLFGAITCVFSVVVWRSSKKSEESVGDNEIKDNSSDFV